MNVSERVRRSVDIPAAQTYTFTCTPIICPRCRRWTGTEVDEGHVIARCERCGIRIEAFVLVLDECTTRASLLPRSAGNVHACVYTPIVCPRCHSRTGAEIPEGKASVYCRRCKVRIWSWIRVLTDDRPVPDT